MAKNSEKASCSAVPHNIAKNPNIPDRLHSSSPAVFTLSQPKQIQNFVI